MSARLPRKLLRLLLAVALAGLVAGCEKVKDLLPGNVFKPEMNLLVWSGYLPDDVLADFERETGIHVNAQIIRTNFELEDILLKNPGKYDLAMPSSFMAKELLEKHLLTPFNLKDLPNLSHLATATYNATFDPDNRYVIPYIWGSTGIGYNADDVAGLPKSWASLFKKDPKRKRRIALLDDARFTLGSALLYLGYSPSTADEAQVVAAGQVIKDLNDDIAFLDNENIALLLSTHRVDMALAWTGDVTVAMLGNPALGVESNLKIRIALPLEGAIVFRDCFVLPIGARHQKSAEKFLNFLLDPKIAGRVTNYSYYATTIKDAAPHVRRAIVNSAAYYIHPYPAKNHFLEDNTPETERIYAKVWADVKATVKARAFDPDHAE